MYGTFKISQKSVFFSEHFVHPDALSLWTFCLLMLCPSACFVCNIYPSGFLSWDLYNTSLYIAPAIRCPLQYTDLQHHTSHTRTLCTVPFTQQQPYFTLLYCSTLQQPYFILYITLPYITPAIHYSAHHTALHYTSHTLLCTAHCYALHQPYFTLYITLTHWFQL